MIESLLIEADDIGLAYAWSTSLGCSLLVKVKRWNFVQTSNFESTSRPHVLPGLNSTCSRSVACLHLMLTALAHATYAQFQTVGFPYDQQARTTAFALIGPCGLSSIPRHCYYSLIIQSHRTCANGVSYDESIDFGQSVRIHRRSAPMRRVPFPSHQPSCLRRYLYCNHSVRSPPMPARGYDTSCARAA